MNFKPGSTYNFKVYPSSQLGADFRNVLVLAELTFAAAVNRGTDIVHLHSTVYNTLPAGVPDDPTRYNYIEIMVNNTKSIIGVPWINSNTIEEVVKQELTAVIYDTNVNEIDRLRLVLVENGFKVKSIG